MAELKLEMSGAKLELNGSEELIKNESTRFYYALGVTDELPETTIHAADISRGSIIAPATQARSTDGECVLSYRLTEAPMSWEEIIEWIKDGSLRLNVSDTISCKLKDEREVDFIVTDITEDAIRFESRDCLGEKVKHTGLDKYCEKIFNLLPDALQAAIMPTERKWRDKDGNLKTGTYKLFVPSCAEIAPEDECIGDKGVYKQLDWYKDRRHRIRCDEKGGDTCWYWTLSSASGYSTRFVFVSSHGYVNDHSASLATGAPVCFQIPKS